MRLSVRVGLVVLVALALYLSLDFSSLGAWAIDMQRGFQNQMAEAVQALKMGDPGAYLLLFSATAAYGFVHAVGPGHGKYLVGGVGLGTEISAMRLVGLAVISSLAQSAWAIVLVYGGFTLFEASVHQMTDLAENILAPASYLAITAVGLIILWRGVKSMRSATGKKHAHSHEACGCHAHGPTPDQAAQVTSLRDAAALVLSIAMRPCTGAIFLLVIAWQMDIRFAGALAVAVMGLGTAGLASLVAVSSVASRGLALSAQSPLRTVQVALPSMQVFAGAIVVIVSLGLFRLAV